MMKKKELEDINKPEMTEEMYETLESCIVEGIQNTLGDLTQDDCDVEFGMEYDGKVYVESVDLQCAYELTEQIVDKVCSLFKEADCPEDDDSQLNTQTVAEKVI